MHIHNTVPVLLDGRSQLELFSGTKSECKVARQYNYEITSLDLKDADINCNILNWIIKYMT